MFFLKLSHNSIKQTKNLESFFEIWKKISCVECNIPRESNDARYKHFTMDSNHPLIHEKPLKGID